MEHEQDETETSDSEERKLSKEGKCPGCHGDVMTCDCLDDVSLSVYDSIKIKAMRKKRYKDVNVKPKFL